MDNPRLIRGAPSILGAIAAGIVSAGVFGIAISNQYSLGFILAYLTPIPLFLAGLSGGIGAAAIAAALGIAALLFLGNAYQIAILYTLAFALPVTMLCGLALRHRRDAAGHLYWYPTGRLLTWLTIYAAGLFIVSNILTMNMPGGLEGTISGSLDQVLELQSQQANVTPEQLAQMKSSMDVLKKIIPSLMMLGWLFLMGISGMISQVALRQQGWALRDNPTFLDIDLPTWLLALVAAAGLAGMLTDGNLQFAARNLFAVLLLPYLFMGLAVFHVWARSTRYKWPIIIVFYVVLFWLVIPIIFLMIIGVLEQWLHLRDRIMAKRSSV